MREAREAQNPLLLEINAGPDEYAASIPALLGDAGIDALMVFYVDFHEGDPEAVLEAISAVAGAAQAGGWHLCCGRRPAACAQRCGRA